MRINSFYIIDGFSISICIALLGQSIPPVSTSIDTFFSTPPGTNLAYPPPEVPGPKPRAEWVSAYERAKEAGLILSTPRSKVVNHEAVYPSSYRNAVCNPGLKPPCNGSVDVWSAPPGVAGISFDDGPVVNSLDLLDYLKDQSQHATHFLIGSRIFSHSNVFQSLDQAGEHLAVHTWSHPMLTSLPDLDIVGELGWTMQLIHDWSRDHVICRYWRPPYGDTDQRVQSIAKHVFDLQSIYWYHDSDDWCLGDSEGNGTVCPPDKGPQDLQGLESTLDLFVNVDKTNGLLILEHEHFKRAIVGFKYIFPRMKHSGWIPKTIADMLLSPWYQ